MAEILWDAAASPDDITYTIREVPLRPQLTLSLLPGVITFTASNTIRWGTITRRNRMAQYRAFDGPIAVSTRDDAADKQVRLAPFSKQHNLGEYERLCIEYERMAGGNRAVLADALYNDAVDLTRQAQNRAEMALGRTLWTGKFDVDENGFKSVADYALLSSNVFTAAKLWSDPTALAGDDLRAMAKAFVKSSGVRPGRIITSESVIDALLKNAQIIAEIAGTQTGKTYITRDELDRWLTNNRLPILVTEYETSFYNEETGLEERVMPEGKIVMTPANLSDILTFTYGISVTAMELIASPRSEMTWGDGAGIVGLAVKSGPPFRQFTFVDAVGLPILSDPRSHVVGTVL